MDDLVQQINELIEKIKGKLDDLLGTVNDFLSWVPWGLGWLADKIKDAWNWLCGEVRGVLGRRHEDHDQHGRPRRAERHRLDVVDLGRGTGERAEGCRRRLRGAQGGRHAGWVTRPGAYAGKAKLHQVALEKVVTTYVTAMSSALDTVRAGLVKFYMGLITALGALVAGIIGGAGVVGDHLRHPRRHLHRRGCRAHRGGRVLHRR